MVKRINITETLLKNNIPSFLAGITLIIVGGIANIVLISIVSESLQPEGEQLFSAPYLFVSVLIAAFTLNVTAQWILEGIGHQIVYKIRDHLLRQVLQSEPEQFQRLDRSKIYNAFSKDILQIVQAIEFTPYTLYGISLIVGGCGYMLWLSWKLALVVLGALAITLIFCNKLVSLAEKMHLHDRDIQNSLVSAYGKIIDGHKELALNEQRSKSVFDEVMTGAALESKKTLTRAGRIISISSQLMGILPIALIGLVLWGVYHLDGDKFHIGVNFAVILLFIRQPLGNLIHQVETIVLARISLRHLANLELPFPAEMSPADALNAQWKTISIESLVYKYFNNDNFTLGPIDFTVNRGELVFLVGSNGAGKSTFVKLLCGLLTPIQGGIYVDNETVCDGNRRQYRAMFSAVLSDFFLFDKILDRTTSAFDNEYAAELLDQLELDRVVSIDDGVFNIVNLSTGQRKRLAMLIACMEGRSILVLDEWAADQDPKFRKIFYEVILPKLKAKGLTLIVISHDDRYFHVADRLITLEGGNIAL